MQLSVLVVLLAIAAPLVAGYIDGDTELLVNHNRVPKLPSVNGVCDECESIVKRIVEAAQDPAKLAELKILLSALCHETVYKQECLLFVGKLDVLIEKLLPYLQDAHGFCTDLHLCSNKKIDVFHRVGLIYAKRYLNKVDGVSDLICSECEFSVKEIQQVVDDPSVQLEVKQFISKNFCAHLGQFQGSCDVLLEDFLPSLFEELHTLLQEPRAFCEHVKLCKPSAAIKKLSQKAIHKEKVAHGAYTELMNRISTTPFKQGKFRAGMPSFSATCIECQIALYLVLTELQSDSFTKSVGYEIRDLVCPLFPSALEGGCDDFVGLYGPTVVQLAMKQMNSQNMCTLFRACSGSSLKQELKLEQMQSLHCEACTEMSKLVAKELESTDMQKRLVHEAQHILCDPVLSVIHESCLNLTHNYIPTVLTKLLQRLQNDQFCQTVHACQ